MDDTSDSALDGDSVAHDVPDDSGGDAGDEHAMNSPELPPSTALIEVLPGVAVVLGDVPDPLRAGLVDFGVVPSADRLQLATALSLVGDTATVGGNLAAAASGAQGLYRVNSATQALLNKGAVLAVKDGANLGSVWLNGELVAQARFIPVSAVTAASAAAAIGPAVAMVALQMQLDELGGLVRTNIALTTQTLGTIRAAQWSDLCGHVETIDRALVQARELESVPASLWDTISGDESALRAQVDLYRRHVSNHVKKIEHTTARERREYLDANREAIAFDTHALMSSLRAWTGYKALQAGRARTAGSHNPDEQRLVEIIVRDTRTELEPALAESTRLVDAVTRELRLIADLTGPTTIPLSRKRKDHNAARQTSTRLLEAIEPLADALRPPPPPVTAPATVCSPKDIDLEPYLRALRWILGQGETLRCIGFCYDRDDADVVAVSRDMLSRIEPESWATLVAVTDRRVIATRASEFRREGKVGRALPLDDVRYVRARTSPNGSRRCEVDLAMRSIDLRWGFHPDTDPSQVDALAAALAESMRLPEPEKEALVQKPSLQIEASTTTGAAGHPTGFEAVSPTSESETGR